MRRTARSPAGAIAREPQRRLDQRDHERRGGEGESHARERRARASAHGEPALSTVAGGHAKSERNTKIE